MIVRQPAGEALPPAVEAALRVVLDLAGTPVADHPVPGAVTLTVGTETPGAAIAAEPGRVTIPRARLVAAADLLTLATERRAPALDDRGRVPPAANALVASAREGRPVVDQLGRELRRAVVAAAGGRAWFLRPWPGVSRWAAAFTHDVDLIRWWALGFGARALELVRRMEWRRLGRATAAALGAIRRSPVGPAIDRLLALEARYEIRATWFFLAGEPTLRRIAAGDVTYPIRAAAPILTRLRELGHEVGLHGSFDTAESAGLLAAERRRLEEAAGSPVAGVRQHFLRMTPFRTQRAMVAAGFEYDATIGFHDRPGFRLGTAGVVPLFDHEDGALLGLDEVPLVWMDRARSKYAGIEDPARWIAEAAESAAACREVDGLWVALWHPNLTAAMGFPGAETAYAALVGRVMADRPYTAPLGDIVRWRRARRAARVVGVDAAGRPIVAGPDGRPAAEYLEAEPVDG